jgi:Zn-dependent protease with chaperone function
VDSETLSLHVASWTLTFLLHGTLLALTAWLALALVKSHALRERLWKIAFAGAFVTATASLFAGDTLPAHRWALRTVEVLRTPARSAAESVAESVTVVPADPFHVPTNELVHGEADAPVHVLGSASPALATHEPTSIPQAAVGPTSFSQGDLPRSLTLLAALWALGALCALVRWGLTWRTLANHIRDRRLLQPGQDAESERAVTILGELVTGAGAREVRLSSSASLSSPISFGLSRPEICIPSRALSRERGLRDEELRALLAHELAHVVRRDPAWLALCGLIECLFWFQPLLKLLRKRWQDDAELCCDDWAVRHTGEGLSLAACLTEVAGWIVRDSRGLPVPSMAAHGAGLGRRVRRLLDVTPAPEARRRWVKPMALLALGGIAAAAPRVDAIQHVPQPYVAHGPDALTEPFAEPIGEPFAQPSSSPALPQERDVSPAPQSEPRLGIPRAPQQSPPVADETIVDKADDADPANVIGPRATPPGATLPAPRAAEPQDSLTALDRELSLLAREAAAMQAELRTNGYPQSWRSKAAKRMDSIQDRIAALHELREHIDALLSMPIPTNHAGHPPVNATGSRSGPQPLR